MDINTVAAGGGSRLFFRAGLFVVGPESASAHPGPVCYRKGKVTKEYKDCFKTTMFVLVTRYIVPSKDILYQVRKVTYSERRDLQMPECA